MDIYLEANKVVEVVDDNLKSASEAALALCDTVAKEAKVISAMSQQEAEYYISKKFSKNANKFIDWIVKELSIKVESRTETDSWFAPIGEECDSNDTSRLKKAIVDFKAVKNAGEKKGWKRFKELLKAVFDIIFAVFIEVAMIVLKLAFSLVVGVIKIGACAISTLASCAGVYDEDIV